MTLFCDTHSVLSQGGEEEEEVEGEEVEEEEEGEKGGPISESPPDLLCGQGRSAY